MCKRVPIDIYIFSRDDHIKVELDLPCIVNRTDILKVLEYLLLADYINTTTYKVYIGQLELALYPSVSEIHFKNMSFELSNGMEAITRKIEHIPPIKL